MSLNIFHLICINMKSFNKLFFPSEKQYYGLKYVVAEIQNNKFIKRI